MKLRKAFFIVVFGFVTNAFTQAQTHEDHVTIVGSFRPTLREFNKINIQPEIENTAFEIGETTITYIDTVLVSNIELELITPVNTKTEENISSFNNFVQAGIGTRISPIFVYKHNSKLAKNTAFGLNIAHHSSWMNKSEYAPSSFMKTQFGLSLDTKLNNLLVKSKVFYKNDLVRFYGFNPDDFPLLPYDIESITENYKTLGFQSHLQSSTNASTKIYHELWIDYQYFEGKFRSNEHCISMKGYGEKSYKWLKSNAKQRIALEAEFANYLNADSISSTNNTQLSLLPSLKLSGEFYQLKLGLRVVFHSQLHSNLHIFPAFEGGLFLFDQSLKFYASLGGNSQRMDYQYYVTENPYVRSIIPQQWQHTPIVFTGGIKALLMPKLDVHIGVEYRQTDNDGFFISDSTAAFVNKFSVIYDKVKVVSFTAEGAFHLNQRLDLKVVYLYNQYANTSLAAAFYHPANQLKFSGEYLYDERIKFTSTVYYVGKRTASSYLDSKEYLHNLNPYIDLNVGCIYKVNDSFDVFVLANNLLNWQYERFYHYPVNGVEFYGGINVRF